jgi:exopolysaccharide biosynthesis protein
VIVGSFDSQGEADRVLESLKGPSEECGDKTFVQYRAGEYRIGMRAFATQAEAETCAEDLATALSIPIPELEAYSQDLTHPEGPWVVDLLEVDPRRVRVEVAHAYDAAIGLETTRSLAQRHGAQAAVNGGFYYMTGFLRGDSQGVLKIEGRLLSEPDRGRGAVGFWQEDGLQHAVFGRVTLEGKARFADGATSTEIAIDGINRARADDQVVLFTPEFHRTTLTGPGGLEIVVAQDRVVAVDAERGSHLIPNDGWVLSIGPTAAAELGSKLPAVGDFPTLTTDLLSLLPDPEKRWRRAQAVVGAGPMLLLDGRRLDDPEAESIARVFSAARHPRTAAGVRADGTLLFVTVDGRDPLRSVGMSLPELTDLFLSLGAVSAVNLDGGGSTTMVVEGQIVNQPTDTDGERANGDGILLFAAGANH